MIVDWQTLSAPPDDRPGGGGDGRPSNHHPLQRLTHLRFAGLWSLSLVGCSTLAAGDLAPLSRFAALGLLDLSTTPVTLLALQRHLRLIHIRELRIVRCPKIDALLGPGPAAAVTGEPPPLAPPSPAATATATTTATTTQAQLRGFVALVLPNVWCLDGVPTLQSERRAWAKYFLGDAGCGRWSLLVRQHYVPFAPRPGGWAGSGGSGGGGGGGGGSGTDAAAAATATVWTDEAVELMRGMPACGVAMAEGLDQLRLGKMVALLRGEVDAAAAARGDGGGGGEAVTRFLKRAGSAEDEDGEDGGSAAAATASAAPVAPGTLRGRVAMAMLLVASLSEAAPNALLQSNLEGFFAPPGASASAASPASAWTRRTRSPLFWDPKGQIKFLGLLVAGLKMDGSSETALGDAHDRSLLQNRLDVLVEDLVEFIKNRLRSEYDSTAADATTTWTAPSAELMLEVFHFLCAATDPVVFVVSSSSILTSLVACLKCLTLENSQLLSVERAARELRGWAEEKLRQLQAADGGTGGTDGADATAAAAAAPGRRRQQLDDEAGTLPPPRVVVAPPLQSGLMAWRLAAFETKLRLVSIVDRAMERQDLFYSGRGGADDNAQDNGRSRLWDRWPRRPAVGENSGTSVNELKKRHHRAAAKGSWQGTATTRVLEMPAPS
ncbi:hypothetical protein DFJ73DRAFT_801650 [Zopfochytrium polystomum]|nr:hypothetical protein DFJ73DRAFT_801650 [Zopfochytrium polystomum]